MVEIPFRVSARAARLIGRENVATSQGAVTELVKNSYDADANACAILFLRRHATAPASLSSVEVAELRQVFADADAFYPLIEGRHDLAPDLDEEQRKALNNALDHILDLWIVDNGTGMTSMIVEDRWMVIGTSAKEVDVRSASGRIVTGAKGIGRFALDRLGHECEMFSGQANSDEIIHWLVNWGDFEGEDKIIGDVTAVLETEQKRMVAIFEEQGLAELLPRTGPTPEEGVPGEPLSFEHGTAIVISQLHDRWDERDTRKLMETLEALLPPKDRGDFNIYVHDHRATAESAWIGNFPPDQFDYRLAAKVDEFGKVTITMERHEIDVPRIRPTTFKLPDMQEEGFRKRDFERGSVSYEKSLRDLLRLKPNQDDGDYRAIGPLDFTMYFMKLSNPTKDNLLRFPQKSFDVAKRRRWMRNSGGIRLYRDQFRVRPYGEPNTQGSDWLLLGERVAANPAAASRPGWRVPPQQVAGTIHITKAGNPLLVDQSNREGIMNERAFATFREIILALIGEFERDRSRIYRNFDRAYKADHADEVTIEEGTTLAESVLADADRKEPHDPGDNDGTTEETSTPSNATKEAQAPSDTTEEAPTPSDTNITLAKTVTAYSRRNEELEGEIQTLRGMATLGTVLVSFTHELKQIKANMGSRQTRMENALKRVVDSGLLKTVPEQVNPFNITARWAREDEKVSRWVDFALASVSPTKRRRRRIDLVKYLKDLRSHWREFTSSRQIEFEFEAIDEVKPFILAHEIDLDSIFYNLIVNSIEAFSIPSDVTTRHISIEMSEPNDGEVKIDYRDNGPGLATFFKRPDEIFEFGASSKSEAASGDITGTGIGMWLLKSIVDDFGGRAVILSAIGEEGFGISITLPEIDAKADNGSQG